METSGHEAGGASAPVYLFSIDLEDVRDFIPEGERYRERVPAMTHRYLDFLDELGARATFFTVGLVARKYPSLLRDIAAAGHEVACHSDVHTPLTEMTADAFRDDLLRNMDSIQAACGVRPSGFRAPTFSLTQRTPWAHEVLADLAFDYSSSVLPADNPLYGWKDFGNGPRRVGGVWEIPMTLSGGWPLSVPFGGGVYFRALPAWFVSRCFRRARRAGATVTGYFHPYDIDLEQERFMHPAIGESRFYNWLMYLGRSAVLPRLASLADRGWKITTYDDYVRSTLDA